MRERLPDWVKAGKNAKDLITWLEDTGSSTHIFSGRLFVKAELGSCILIYTEPMLQAVNPNRFHSCELCGVYRKNDSTLYEVGPALYRAVGIPEEFCFPGKSEIQKDLEEKVTANGRERIKQEWDQLVLSSGFTKEQLMPVIKREQIRMTAKRYFQMGKGSKHIAYLPRFSFAAIQSELSDEIFLKYLEDEESAVGTVTNRWLMKMLADISKKRIFYGCVREEMEEMEKANYSGVRNKNESFQTQNVEKKTA